MKLFNGIQSHLEIIFFLLFPELNNILKFIFYILNINKNLLKNYLILIYAIEGKIKNYIK